MRRPDRACCARVDGRNHFLVEQFATVDPRPAFSATPRAEKTFSALSYNILLLDFEPRPGLDHFAAESLLTLLIGKSWLVYAGGDTFQC